MHVVLATLKIKAGTSAEFVAVAKRMAEAVKANEPGNHGYELLKTDSDTSWVFLERYQDEAAVEAHRKSDHFRTIGKEMGQYMDGKPELLRLSTLD